MDCLDGITELVRRYMDNQLYIVLRNVVPSIELDNSDIQTLKDSMKKRKPIFQHVKSVDDPKDKERNDNKRNDVKFLIFYD